MDGPKQNTPGGRTNCREYSVLSKVVPPVTGSGSFKKDSPVEIVAMQKEESACIGAAPEFTGGDIIA